METTQFQHVTLHITKRVTTPFSASNVIAKYLQQRDVPISEKARECVEVVRLTQHERVQRWTAGHVGVPWHEQKLRILDQASEYNKKEEEMQGFDPSLSETWKVVRDQNQRTDRCQREREMKGYSAAIDQLISERQTVIGDPMRFFGQHEELNQEIQAKIAWRQRLFSKEVSLKPHME